MEMRGIWDSKKDGWQRDGGFAFCICYLATVACCLWSLRTGLDWMELAFPASHIADMFVLCFYVHYYQIQLLLWIMKSLIDGINK